MSDQRIKERWTSPSGIVAIFVVLGSLSGCFTSGALFYSKVQDLERRVAASEKRVEVLADLSERLTRVETKIDMLLKAADK